MRGEGHWLAIRAPIADGAPDAVRSDRQARDDGLRVDLHADRHAAILEGPDHLEAGPVADVGEARVGVTAERALEDPPVARPVEDRAPHLELADALRCFARVQLRHARVVEVPTAHHGVAEVR